MNNQLNLWGWNSHWEEAFRPWKEILLPGRVTGQSHHLYTLEGPQGPVKAQVSGAFEYRTAGPEDFPALGDWVAFQAVPGNEGVIQQLLPRKSQVCRKAPVDRGGLQVLAANLDLGIIVMGLDQDYSPARAERYLTLLTQGNAPGLVWLSKADLFPEKAQTAREDLTGRWPGVPVLTGGAGGEDPWSILSPWFTPGATICLLGSSGAGKSTLLNALAGENLRKTGTTRSTDGKGRHTSVDRVLVRLGNGTLVMDHPGLREVALSVDGAVLGEVFAPVSLLAQECRFADCTHSGEPGCAVQKALEEGTLDSGLWGSYQRQNQELKALARRTDPVLAREERAKWKAIHKSLRGYSKEKRHDL